MVIGRCPSARHRILLSELGVRWTTRSRADPPPLSFASFLLALTSPFVECYRFFFFPGLVGQVGAFGEHMSRGMLWRSPRGQGCLVPCGTDRPGGRYPRTDIRVLL